MLCKGPKITDLSFYSLQVKIHPMSFLWRKMPMFDFFFTGALTNNDVGFVSDQKIKDISVPILILHAKVTLVLDKITS